MTPEQITERLTKAIGSDRFQLKIKRISAYVMLSRDPDPCAAERAIRDAVKVVRDADAAELEISECILFVAQSDLDMCEMN